MEKMLVVVAAVAGLLSLAEGATLGQSLSGTVVRDLMRTAGLLDTLNNDGPYTLFVPSDLYLLRYLSSVGSSVSDLKADPVALKDILLNHVVSGTIPHDQLYNERLLTTVNGNTIRVNNYSDRRVTVQGVAVQSRSTSASNGIIYYLVAPIEPANGTVADVIKSQSDLSTLLTAAQAAGIVEFLIDQNPITVFAPTDQAFSALGDKVTTLLENPPLLAQILQYHVVPGTLYTSGMHTEDLHTFEEADKLHLTSRFSLTVDGGHLSRSGDDLSATNGVVHKIDKVLIPESLQNQL